MRPGRITLYLKFYTSFHMTSLANSQDKLLSLMIIFLCVYPRFCPFQAKFLMIFVNHQYYEKRSFALFFQCQNLISALFISTLKFANRIIFVPQIFLGLPVFSSWLRPWCQKNVPPALWNRVFHSKWAKIGQKWPKLAEKSLKSSPGPPEFTRVFVYVQAAFIRHYTVSSLCWKIL